MTNAIGIKCAHDDCSSFSGCFSIAGNDKESAPRLTRSARNVSARLNRPKTVARFFVILTGLDEVTGCATEEKQSGKRHYR
jgi:hypothetical protein